MSEPAALTREQRTLVQEACLSRDRVVCVVGVAGSGKTTALRLLGAAYGEAGVPVVGAAPSGRAAEELETTTGIRSSTMHRLLLDAQRERGLPHGCVLVIDEAGMAETRALTPILRLVDEVGGKTILVGDPGQLPAVGAGGLFPALCDRLGAIVLTESRRQRDPAERKALAQLRAGNPEQYLSHAAAHGRLNLAANPTEAKTRQLEEWWHAAERDLGEAVMLAYRRSDVRELNDAARTLLIETGRLGSETLQFGRREYRVGDRVICRHNDTRCNVRNGTCGTVVELDPAKQTLVLRTDTGTLRRISRLYATDHLDHAYALTGHAAQGGTVERAFVLLSHQGALREWGYVACSRARRDTRLFITGEAREQESPGHEMKPAHTPTRIAHALSTSSADQLALDRHEEATPSGMSRRTLLNRQQQLRAAHLHAEDRLAAAERKLEKLGWCGRRRDGPQLRAEIGYQRAASEPTTKELADIAPQLRALKRTARTRELDKSRASRQELSRGSPQREAPELELGL